MINVIDNLLQKENINLIDFENIEVDCSATPAVY